jgi:hypothetical protein
MDNDNGERAKTGRPGPGQDNGETDGDNNSGTWDNNATPGDNHYETTGDNDNHDDNEGPNARTTKHPTTGPDGEDWGSGRQRDMGMRTPTPTTAPLPPPFAPHGCLPRQQTTQLCPNDRIVVWASGKFFFVFVHVFLLLLTYVFILVGCHCVITTQ